VREGDEIPALLTSASFDLARYRKFPVPRKKSNPIAVTTENLSPSSGFHEVSADKSRSLPVCRIATGKRLGHRPLERYSRSDGGRSQGEEQCPAIQVFAGAHKPQWTRQLPAGCLSAKPVVKRGFRLRNSTLSRIFANGRVRWRGRIGFAG